MGIKLSWGSGQMGPAGSPQPILFIKKKKEKEEKREREKIVLHLLPAALGFARGGRYRVRGGRRLGAQMFSKS